MKNLKAMALAGILALSVGGLGTFLINENLLSKGGIKKGDTLKQKTELLEPRVKSFHDKESKGEYGKVYEILSPSIREHILREEYEVNLKKLYDGIDLIYENQKTIKVTNKYAITEYTINVSSKKEKFSSSECQRSFWVWDKDNWYFERESSCMYDFKDEIKRINEKG